MVHVLLYQNKLIFSIIFGIMDSNQIEVVKMALVKIKTYPQIKYQAIL